ncbi:extracellular solute-binding protein [Paenibacillus rhizovicinus]|uniref:Extracellular solute-binding protein n=1 Tax=Paenibacillus rhizovicinus TaxID=2704463 RepID=A0A6C0PA80_9BACL|nr:extracellular solute-binding protein [Paenibacillus rhizovicinus]QHW33442.1 extracellular solute-binding protein [Paenibacillus rhizovicinus]
MMKSTLSLSAAIFVCMWLSGCTDANSQQAENADKAFKPQVKIKLGVQSSAATKDLERQLDDFNANHAAYKVELMPLPTDGYDETLNMLMTSGQAPDVFQIGTDWLTTYVYKNWLQDLSEIVDGKISEHFPRWAAEYTKENEHYYAVPSSMMTLRLVYNKDLLKAGTGCLEGKPPATLDELRVCADSITKAGTGYRKYGFALPAGEDWAGFIQPLELANTYSGIDYYDFAHGRYDFTVYRPWFETILAMKREGGLFPGEISLKSDTALTQFAQGNIGMMYMSNRDFAQFSAMDAHAFQWGVAMPPLLDASLKGKGALIIYPDPPFVINAFSEHKQEAAELWEFLQSPSFLGALYKQGNLIPTRQDVTGDSGNQPLLPEFEAFLPGSEESPYPQEPKFILQDAPSSSGPKNIGDSLRMKVYRQIVEGVEKPEAALEALTELYNKSLNEAKTAKLINIDHYVFPSFDPLHPLLENQ